MTNRTFLIESPLRKPKQPDKVESKLRLLHWILRSQSKRNLIKDGQSAGRRRHPPARPGRRASPRMRPLGCARTRRAAVPTRPAASAGPGPRIRAGRCSRQATRAWPAIPVWRSRSSRNLPRATPVDAPRVRRDSTWPSAARCHSGKMQSPPIIRTVVTPFLPDDLKIPGSPRGAPVHGGGHLPQHRQSAARCRARR